MNTPAKRHSLHRLKRWRKSSSICRSFTWFLQASSLKACGRQRKAVAKQQWHRTNRDKQQQTDQLDETAERQTDAVVSELQPKKD